MSEIEIKDRILRILTSENLSSSKFAEIVGVQRSSISHILSGRNKPSLDFLQKILSNFPNINGDWLIIGKGDMIKKSEQAEFDFKTEKSVDRNPDIQFSNPKSENVVREKVFIEKQPEIVKERKIKKIVVFYDDNTFEELAPNG